MEYVIKEVDGIMDWFYEPSETRYYKFDKKNKVRATIAGKYLPDPYALEASRLTQAAELPEEQRKNLRIKCTPVTHFLWQHWRGIING